MTHTKKQNTNFSGPEVFFKTCVTMKFVDNDDDDEEHWTAQNPISSR